jgi:CHAD domain-containing protein
VAVSDQQFLLAEETTPAAMVAALEQRLEVSNGGLRRSDRTYYDTFDALARDAGLAVAHEDGTLKLIERHSGDVRLWTAAARPDRHLFATDLDPGPVRDALLDVASVRALLPLVRVRTRERALSVLDDERKTVVRMTLEEPEVVTGSRRQRLHPRLRTVAVRGYESRLHEVQMILSRELGLNPCEQPLLDEAVVATGGRPEGIGSKISVPLAFDERSDRAAAHVLRALLEVIEANLDGTIADIDTEFLHDYRVSVRRSRSVQRELKHVFPAGRLAHYRAEFRWLQQSTGDTRDLDVYVVGFGALRWFVPEEMREDLDPLLALLRARRRTARRAMVQALRSQRARSLMTGWGELLDGLEQLPEAERPDAARAVGEVSGARIRTVYRRMVRMGEAIDDSAPADAYHELRKRGKELRYLLELFGAPLYPPDVVKPMIKSLKSLQDVLGRHQDREVQVAMLTSAADELTSVQGGAAALMATGVLVSGLRQDELAARAEFAETFAQFAAKSQRELVRETFA